jgi:hypothetical protein
MAAFLFMWINFSFEMFLQALEAFVIILPIKKTLSDGNVYP